MPAGTATWLNDRRIISRILPDLSGLDPLLTFGVMTDEGGSPTTLDGQILTSALAQTVGGTNLPIVFKYSRESGTYLLHYYFGGGNNDRLVWQAVPAAPPAPPAVVWTMGALGF